MKMEVLWSVQIDMTWSMQNSWPVEFEIMWFYKSQMLNSLSQRISKLLCQAHLELVTAYTF